MNDIASRAYVGMAPHEHNRSRSRSPYRDSGRQHSRPAHHHSRSPHERRHKHHHSSHHKRKRSPPADVDSYIPLTAVPPRTLVLPYKATHISKHDLSSYKPLFASYLDIQKGKIMEDMDDNEVKGRWKSFVTKWNRGDLAAGWYDPATLQKAVTTAEVLEKEDERPSTAPQLLDHQTGNVDDSDDDIGPAPAFHQTAGAAVPTRGDLTLRNEANMEAQADARNELAAARKADRRLQKERLDDLVPRAEAGTRERQVEEKREVAASNKAFGDAKGGGDYQEVGEGELMGGEAGVKEMKQREERKKNEREVKREEILRARAQERDERLVGLREREDRTMAMLRGLAKERFG